MGVKVGFLLLVLVATTLAVPSRPWPKKAVPKPKSSRSSQGVNLGLPRGGISNYKTTIINEKQAILVDRRRTPNAAPSKKHKREAEPSNPWPKKSKSSKSTQEVNLGLPGGGISQYKTTIINERKAILEDRRKTPNLKHKREAEPSNPWPKKSKSSKSTQEVNLGLPGGGISQYKTTIINERKAILEDRRKTPNLKHKREAEPSRAWPKPKSSRSSQQVNIGLPRGGISSYKTTIINENKAILKDRRRTPNPAPKKH